MDSLSASAFPAQCDIRVRQGDLGRNGAVSTIGIARWLEDARIRVKLPRFERLAGAGEFGPHQIILVSQRVERLACVFHTDADVQVHTGIRHIGRSSFTYEQAVFAGGRRVGGGGATVLHLGPTGPLALPDELIADLTDLALPDSSETAAPRPGTERRQRDRYPFFVPLRARIGDVDSNQHVNYLAMASWYDEAVAVFTAAALGENGLVPDLSPSSYRIDYLGEVTYPGDYEIGVLIRAFGDDSVDYELGIFRGRTCVGVADASGARGVLSAKSLGPGSPRERGCSTGVRPERLVQDQGLRSHHMQHEPIVLDTTGADIHAESARIRRNGPITRVMLPGGVPAWSVTDTAVLRRLLTDSRVSKDAGRHWPAFEKGDIPKDWPLRSWVAVDNMFTAYGSEHRRLRKLVSPAFTHRRTMAMSPRIEAITADLLDRLSAIPPGVVVDLRQCFAYPVPIRVISELIGVPDHLAAALHACVDRFFNTSGTRKDPSANYLEMYRLVGELVDCRRDAPGDDITSVLTATYDEDGTPLTEKELVDTLMLIISAGHETTVNLLDHAIFALLTHPQQRADVLEGRSSWTDVVEETLRYQAPIAHLPLRFAVEDLDIDGLLIPKGDAILASYAVVGRDPKVHGPNADDFDVHRGTRDQHVAFGHGAHHCLGAPLARLEAQIALPALFARFPRLSLAAEPSELRPMGSFIANGHSRLPVSLTA
ncbi:cytochrome P450 [Nocardia sp. CA-107356]|uniref:cytochrome P450 n=1 Tax=Nocardia sp. CA-107356 TaxID=3239972 RepID=UPI003D8ECCFA